MRYILMDPETLDDSVDILLEFAVGLNPHIEEEECREIMLQFLRLNKLSVDAAGLLGSLLRTTENTQHSTDIH